MQTKKQQQHQPKGVFSVRMEKPIAKKLIHSKERKKMLFMRIEKPIFKVQLIAVCLNKKKRILK